MARGLDYYTGAIYEAVLVDEGREVGSIAAGGRYDDLVGMFNPKGNKIPCVGFSIGIERIFTIIEKKRSARDVDVFVCSVEGREGKGDLIIPRMKILSQLWSSGIRAEMSYKEKPRFVNQLEYCEKNNILIAILVGENEWKKGVVKIKSVFNREDKGVEVLIENMVNEVKKVIEQLN